MATLAELREKAERIRQEALHHEPEYWQGLQAEAQAEIAAEEARLHVDLTSLKATYDQLYEETQAAQEQKLSAASAFVRATEDEIVVREQLRATVRRLHAAGEIVPHIGALHTAQDYTVRKQVEEFTISARRSF
jgi:hypothetical protein